MSKLLLQKLGPIASALVAIAMVQLFDGKEGGGPQTAVSSQVTSEQVVSEAEQSLTDELDDLPTRAFRPALRGEQRFDRSAAHRAILVFEDLHKAYRADVPVLKGLTTSVARGEFVFITGPSGAGKSTLLRMIYAAEKADHGRILFLGRDVCRLSEKSIPYLRRNIGIVFQDFKLVQNWTVSQNVAIALEVLGVPERIVRRRVGEALERVGLGGRGQDKASCLSGGEQQRVAIARAIVPEPALILADEPTGNLDPQLAVDILGLFEDIHETGVTVLFATHDRSLLDVRPRRVVVLDEGRTTDVRAGLNDDAVLAQMSEQAEMRSAS